LLRSPNIFNHGGAAAPPYQFEIEMRLVTSTPTIKVMAVRKDHAAPLATPK
jgi:hypothetical protein